MHRGSAQKKVKLRKSLQDQRESYACEFDLYMMNNPLISCARSSPASSSSSASSAVVLDRLGMWGKMRAPAVVPPPIWPHLKPRGSPHDWRRCRPFGVWLSPAEYESAQLTRGEDIDSHLHFLLSLFPRHHVCHDHYNRYEGLPVRPGRL